MDSYSVNVALRSLFVLDLCTSFRTNSVRICFRRLLASLTCWLDLADILEVNFDAHLGRKALLQRCWIAREKTEWMSYAW